MTHYGQDREAMEVGNADARVEPADLRVVPPDRKEDGRIQQVAEVISVVRVLPEVVPIDDEVSSERLLESCMESVTLSGANRPRGSPKNRVPQRMATHAGDQPVLEEAGLS